MASHLREAFNDQNEQFQKILAASTQAVEELNSSAGAIVSAAETSQHLQVQTNVILSHISSQLLWVQRAILENKGESF